MTLLETRRLFILNDRDPSVGGASEVTTDFARRWNGLGHGVFWVINDFVGERLKANLTQINAWFFEIDDIPKSAQLAVIETGLYPSLVVESKNSFHTYFFARTSEPESFEEIQARLIQFYGSDEKIKDPLRLMRAPGFKHLKDNDDPFDVEIIWRGMLGGRPITYSPKVMKHFYPPPPEKKTGTRMATPGRESINAETFNLFELLYNLDHLRVLQDFSGSSWVQCESYTFKDNRNGKWNILVNGKQTHAFIDAQGRIGAVNGGPTIWQWLKYFGHDSKAIRTAIKEVLGI